MALDLHIHMVFPIDGLQRIYRKNYPADVTVTPERSGLSKAFTFKSKAWIDVRDTLISEFTLFSGDDNDMAYHKDVDWDTAIDMRQWMSKSTRYSIARLLRMHLAMDEEYEIPKSIRWALQIYETLICQQGAILGSTGHTILPVDLLVGQICSEYPLTFLANQDPDVSGSNHIRYTKNEAEDLISQLIEEKYLGVEHGVVYVLKYRDIEEGLISYLSAPTTIVKAGPDVGIRYMMDPGQTAAFYSILNSTTVGSVLGGIPGSGKTYTCREIRNFYNMCGVGDNVVALATTGAAAMVLARQLGCTAYTISSAYFNKSLKAKLTKDIYIVDECSMLNMEFARQLLGLLTICKPQKVILVGDPAQLPPVGAGALFEALVKNPTAIPNMPVHVLTTQHRMAPESVAVLKQFSTTVSHQASAQKIITEKWPLNKSIPVSSVTSVTHAAHNWSIWAILRFLLQGCPVNKITIDNRTAENRALVSTYTNNNAAHFNQLIESYRCRHDPTIHALRGQLEVALKPHCELFQNWYAHPNTFPRPTKMIKSSQVLGYVNNFYTRQIDNPEAFQYQDELEFIENNIRSIFLQLKHALREHMFTKGGFYRCSKNGWFTKWVEGRSTATKADWGIRTNEDIANGQIFTAIADDVLYCDETQTTVNVVDRDKASHIFRTSWVSTTHKLQGDQAAISIYIHTPDAENRLVYVALSRGRERNIIIQNTTNPRSCFMRDTILCAQSTDRLSVAAELGGWNV